MRNISARFPTFSAVFSKTKSVIAPLGAKWFPRRRLKRIGLTVAVVVAFYTLFGFVGLPVILKSVIVSQASKALARPVSIAHIRVNPYALSVTINGIEVGEPDGKEKFVAVGEIYVNAEAASIFRLAPVLREIRVESPYVHIVRLDKTRFNFSDLIKPSTPKPKPSKPLLFSLNNIRIHNGDIRYSDKVKGKEHSLSAIYLDVPSVSNFPYYIETDVQPRFSAKFDGSHIALAGETKPFAESRETTLNLAIRDLDIPYYLSYAPFDLDYKVLSGALSVNATLAYVEFKHRPPTLTLWADTSLSRVEVVDTAAYPMVKLPRFALEGITCRPLDALVRCRRVSIEGLNLNVTRDASGKINLMSLVPSLPAAPASPAPKAAEKAFILDVGEIALTEAAVAFADRLPPTPFATKLSPINAHVTDFSTLKGRQAAYEVSFATESNEKFSAKGLFCLDPMRVVGGMNLDDAVLKKYAPYYQDAIRFDLADGTLGIGSAYEISMDKTLDVSASDITVTLAALKLQRRDNGRVFLDIPLASVSQARCDLAKQELYVGALRTERAVFAARRMKNGTLDLMDVMPLEDHASPTPAPAAPERPVTPTAASAKPWQMTLKDLNVQKYTLNFVDEVPEQPATVSLHNLRLRLNDFSTAAAPDAQAAFQTSFDVNDAGSLALKGRFALQPMAATVRLGVKKLGLKLAQPYVGEFAKLLITSGSVSTDMKIAVKQGADGQFAINAEGGVSVDKLATVDMQTGELVKWDNLALTDIRASMAPLQASVGEISLTGLDTNVVVAADGTMNLTDVLPPAPLATEPAPVPLSTAPTAAAVTPQPQAISIGKMTFKDGKVAFTDKSISPNYSLNIAAIDGKVEGFSLKGDTVGTIDVGARLDQAPLRITGRLKPVVNDLFAEAHIELSDMELSPFTPYSEKYVGYPVSKGKLSLNLQYLINQRKVDLKNSIFTDQFTFGDRVDSPTATNLPVKLALALLTDRRGQIKLDIPVSGSLDDPKFRVLPIVLHVVVNLVEKAATSPFALIGSLVGGGEEISFVEFSFGGAELDEPAKKKLDKLVGALADRPALRLEIRPQIDALHDTDAIRKTLFDRKLKAQKLKEMIAKGSPVVPVDRSAAEIPISRDQITVAPEEYERLLTLAYEAEDMPKPRTIIGTLKKQPREEMERMLNEHIKVTPDDLRALAYRRAAAVRDYMLASSERSGDPDLSGKTIEPERLFLVEPEMLPSSKTADAKAARVVFNLTVRDSSPSGAQFNAPPETAKRPNE